MISNSFNNLTSEQRNNIYKSLSNLFNKENIDFFIEKKTHKIYQQEIEDFVLTKDFSIKKWEMFQSLFNFRSFSENKKHIVSNILSDVEKIAEKIEWFNRVDEIFNFDLAIAGGALRDILLMKEPKVKDIDLILSFKYKKHLLENYFNFGYNKSTKDKEVFKKALIKSSLNLKKYGFKEFDVKKITELHNLDDMIREYLMNVVYIIINKDFKAKLFHSTEFKNTANLQNIINSSDYNDKHLKGVIKVKDKQLNFDIDILLTSVEVDSYLKAFDYSICKIMSILIRDNKYLLEKKNIKDFIKSVILNDEIYEDLIKHQITFNIDRFTKKEIESSIKNHYPRIKEKYPNYSLILKTEKSKNTELVESLNLFIKLNETLKKDKSFNNNIIKI